MKTLRCISLKATGLLHVNVPAYGLTISDGEEFPVADDAVVAFLKNPNFEEVQVKPAPFKADSSEVQK